MGIDLWFKTRFVMQKPPIFKVNVLNYKSIKVTRYAVKESEIPVHVDPGFHFKVFKKLSWW